MILKVTNVTSFANSALIDFDGASNVVWSDVTLLQPSIGTNDSLPYKEGAFFSFTLDGKGRIHWIFQV